MSEFILIGWMNVFKSKFDVELIVLFKRLFNEHFNFSLSLLFETKQGSKPIYKP